jgi:hypothetical protein
MKPIKLNEAEAKLVNEMFDMNVKAGEDVVFTEEQEEDLFHLEGCEGEDGELIPDAKVAVGINDKMCPRFKGNG